MATERKAPAPKPHRRGSSGKGSWAGGEAGFVPTVKLDPTAVRDLRADTRSERAGTRMSQPPMPRRSTGRSAGPRMRAR